MASFITADKNGKSGRLDMSTLLVFPIILVSSFCNCSILSGLATTSTSAHSTAMGDVSVPPKIISWWLKKVSYLNSEKCKMILYIYIKRVYFLCVQVIWFHLYLVYEFQCAVFCKQESHTLLSMYV